MKPVLVVGSVNMDLVVEAARAPGAGETLSGTAFHTIPGGKGANQAVAAARLGAPTQMLARVGDDAFGGVLRDGLRDAGVDVAHVMPTQGVASGVAVITVEADGENRILIVPGANGRLTPADVQAAEDLFAAAGTCLLQLEVPLETVAAAVKLCRRHGVKVVLDPAPAVALPDTLWTVDVLSPNASEAAVLLAGEARADVAGAPLQGGATGSRESDDVAQALQARGARHVVLKRGASGSFVRAEDGEQHAVPAFGVDVVDTTAAGDAFTAALGVALAEGRAWVDALRFANAAGALTCTTLGAQPALPTRQAVDALIARGEGASDAN